MNKAYKKIIGITGSTGTLGKSFIKQYKNKFIFKCYKDRIENISEFKKWIITNKNIDFFLHFAAISTISESKKKNTLNINTKSTIVILKLINKLRLSNLKYFLFASSSHVYKPSKKKLNENAQRLPVNKYGLSKKKVEDFIFINRKKFYFKIGICRIFNFYSKNQKKGFFIYDMIEKISNSLKFAKIYKINTERDYIKAKQLSEMIYFLIKKEITQVVNLGSGKKINLINIIKMIKKKHKLKIKLLLEKTRYNGLVADINFLRKLGYKKKIQSFKYE